MTAARKKGTQINGLEIGKAVAPLAAKGIIQVKEYMNLCYNSTMPSKPQKPTDRTQARASNVSLYPLNPDEALKAVLSISKKDAKRIISSKPGKRKASGST